MRCSRMSGLMLRSRPTSVRYSPRREVRVEEGLLRHVAHLALVFDRVFVDGHPIQRDVALARLEQAHDQVDRCALARAVRSEVSDDFTGRHVKVDALECQHPAVALGQVCCLQHVVLDTSPRRRFVGPRLSRAAGYTHGEHAGSRRSACVPAPPLKWAGGSDGSCPVCKPLWDRIEHRRLVEPFCGGLAVALGLHPAQALLNDINPHMIGFYRWLRRGWRSPCPSRTRRRRTTRIATASTR